ncbi:hypothetical protein LC087_06115 [Bacillus carboniphilus]|uniref:Hydrolase n=1 Tax=Bacillus carboniphilus TaxID=86663 RepID=A0ABY9JY53_9BACI|nr:hypothetical protein [Bacillus carboniphilus]WLR43709.1 hypothetical protein LC087_06115 [Bacillus carboniphilus]
MKKALIILCLCVLCAFESEEQAVEKVDLNLEENEIGITFLHLSKGEATLIQDWTGSNFLVNTGGEGTEKELFELLKMFGVESLQAVIVTKDTNGYVNNLASLYSTFKGSQWISGQRNVENGNLDHYISLKEWDTWKVNESVKWQNELQFYILHDNVSTTEHLGLDFVLTYGEHSLLYMSSANKQVEIGFLNKSFLQEIDFIKVPEFGDAAGTSRKFIDYIDPNIAIIFQGEDKNPSQDVIERLYSTWIDIYTTKQFGNVSIKMNKETYEVIPIFTKEQ